MKHLIMAGLFVAMGGCDTGERVSRLEKQNQELKTEIKKNQAAIEYDLATKCSRDGKAWFKENFPPDKDTAMLTYSNHYNRSHNKCFLFVEWHYNMGKQGSWTNHMSLWDVNENLQYADFSQGHIVMTVPEYHVEHQRVQCHANTKNCASEDDFNAFVKPFLND